MELKVGDILWQMTGKEQNDVVRFYAAPHSIETIDERKILFENGCGGSRNNIGKTWFYTRDEAIDNFVSKFKSLEVGLPELDSETKRNVTHLPRTDFQNLIIVRDDTVHSATVYTGHVDGLCNITDCLHWHNEYVDALYMNVQSLTLSEIWEQVRKISNRRIVTVFVDGPLQGEIYQCGNHEEGKWEKIGETRGYA